MSGPYPAKVAKARFAIILTGIKHGIAPHHLIGRSRRYPVRAARQDAQREVLAATGWSQGKVGAFFGCSRWTIAHSLKRGAPK